MHALTINPPSGRRSWIKQALFPNQAVEAAPCGITESLTQAKIYELLLPLTPRQQARVLQTVEAMLQDHNTFLDQTNET